MRKPVLLIMMMVWTLVSNASDRVAINVDSIKTSVQSSPDDYRRLLNRFVVADTSLTIDELAVVYYGAPFFSDIKTGRYEEKIDEAYSKRDFNLMYLLSDNALRENPVSLNLLAMTTISANNSEDASAMENVGNMQLRMAMLVNLIMVSGDGLSVESPLLVTSEDDRLVYLMYDSNIEEIEGQSVISDCVAVKVRYRDAGQPVIIYFKEIKP